MNPGASAFLPPPSLILNRRAIELVVLLHGRGDVLNPRWERGFRLAITDDLGTKLYLNLSFSRISDLDVLILVAESLSLSLSLGREDIQSKIHIRVSV